MDLLPAAIVALVVVNLVLLVWLLAGRRGSAQQNERLVESNLNALRADLVSQQLSGFNSLREQLDAAGRMINERLSEGSSTLDRRMGIISEIENRLGELTIRAQNIETIGQNIQSLSELLKPPKLRGNLGEYFLENLLAQILPKSLITTQHLFKNGQRVDAVIKIGDRLLPIDAKFPLDAFQRLTAKDIDGVVQNSAAKEFAQALRRHIDAISDKYILPDENTTDFAVMYIPSEAVYYQFVASERLEDFQYALSRKVIPSSPGHLYGFLASIAAIYIQSGLQTNQRALVDSLGQLEEALKRLFDLNEKISTALRTSTQRTEKAREIMLSAFDRLRKVRDPETEETSNIHLSDEQIDK